MLEETFAGYLLESDQDRQFKRGQYEQRFRQMVEKLGTPDGLECGIRDYIAFVSKLHGQRKLVFLEMLTFAVQQQLLSSKCVATGTTSS